MVSLSITFVGSDKSVYERLTAQPEEPFIGKTLEANMERVYELCCTYLEPLRECFESSESKYIADVTFDDVCACATAYLLWLNGLDTLCAFDTRIQIEHTHVV